MKSVIIAALFGYLSTEEVQAVQLSSFNFKELALLNE